MKGRPVVLPFLILWFGLVTIALIGTALGYAGEPRDCRTKLLLLKAGAISTINDAGQGARETRKLENAMSLVDSNCGWYGSTYDCR